MTDPISEDQRNRVLLRAVLALGVGSFAIGTGEFVIMGLLPEVATDIGVSIPQAGHVISAYALGVVIGAPVLAYRAVYYLLPLAGGVLLYLALERYHAAHSEAPLEPPAMPDRPVTAS